jgi:hypothetical protein
MCEKTFLDGPLFVLQVPEGEFCFGLRVQWLEAVSQDLLGYMLPYMRRSGIWGVLAGCCLDYESVLRMYACVCVCMYVYMHACMCMYVCFKI